MNQFKIFNDHKVDYMQNNAINNNKFNNSGDISSFAIPNETISLSGASDNNDIYENSIHNSHISAHERVI